MSKLFRYLLTSCLIVMFASVAAYSQATATLSGTVQDQQGAMIPGAAVTVVSSATGARRNVTTNDDGQFTVTFLPPGNYVLTISRDGFMSVQISDYVLNVADSKSLAVSLNVGDVRTAPIEVSPNDFSEVSIKSDVGTVIPGEIARNMPLNGRSFSSLALLTPGVTVVTSGGSTGEAGQFSVNGQRPSTNAYVVDGVGANIGITPASGGITSMALSGAYPGTAALGGTSNLVNIDGLQEFKIQTSGYAAESGRQVGGQIQVITRSGTNEVRGSLFEYFRNEALDARNYFNVDSQPQTPLRQNIFGGTIGGPVYLPNIGDGGSRWYNGKDRTFFFVSYEGQRLILPTSRVVTVPSIRLRQRAGAANSAVAQFLNAFPIPTGPEGIVTCTVAASDPICVQTPDPNDPASAGTKPNGAATVFINPSLPSNQDSTSVRLDHSIGDKTRLFARFNESHSFTDLYSLPVTSRNLSTTRTLTVGSTSAFNAKFSNEFRFNWSRQGAKSERLTRLIGGAAAFDESLLTNGFGGTGTLSMSLPGGSFSVLGGTFSDSFQRQINIIDNFSYVLGPHRLKFGVDYRRLSPIYAIKDTNTINFSTESSIVNGIATTYGIVAWLTARPRFDNFSVYAQDSWAATKRLTLDFGLRWDLNPAPTEADGQMPRVALGIVGTDVSNATLAPPGTPFYKTDYQGFAPRFGAAYLLRRAAGRETVVRGAFGVFYDLGSGTASQGWPLLAVQTTANVPFPIPPANAVRPPFTQATTASFGLAEDLRLPYSLHWNLAVEQSLGKSQSLSISYVASASRRLLTSQTLNRTGVDPISGVNIPRPNPNFGDITVSFSGATSDYHSMQAQYKASMKDKLQVLLNYTWAHAIDDASTDIIARVFDRGNANFDVRHNFSGALHYELPAPKSLSFLSYLLKDWSADMIVHAQSGLPVNISTGSSTVSLDGQLFTARPDLVPGVPLYVDDPNVPGGRRFNALAFRAPTDCVPVGQPGCVNRIVRQGTFGRNVLRELPIYQVDLSIGRTFTFGERLRLVLKGDAFNLFNHPMFGEYTTALSNSTFGVPQTARNVSLGGMNGLHQLGGPRSIQLSTRLTF